MSIICYQNIPQEQKFLNKSVYFKMYNNIYFNNNFKNIIDLDKDLIPKELVNNITDLFSIKNKKLLRKKIMNFFIVPSLDKNKIILINNIIKLYTQLQLRFNYINTGKCCSNIFINYDINNSNKSVNKLKNNNKYFITCQNSHDMFVYLFYNKNQKFSYFYNLFLVCQKIQDLMNNNIRKINKKYKFFY